MADPYTDVSVANYNDNPPADDGSAVATNRVDWSTIKTKLSDPLNTAVAAINTIHHSTAHPSRVIVPLAK